MKKFITLFIFGLLCQFGFAQSYNFSSYESLIGKTVYFYAHEMRDYSIHLTVYTMEKGKYVVRASDPTKRLSHGFSYPSYNYNIYDQLNGFIHIDGIIVDKNRELIKATKDNTTYYLEKNEADKYLPFMRNAEQWETEVSELNKNFNYYVTSQGSGTIDVVGLHWSFDKVPESRNEEVRYKATSEDGHSDIESLSVYGRTFSYVQTHPEKFISEREVLERKEKAKSDFESNDGLSKQGLILVGRFYNKSIRLYEVRDSLSLFIGLEEDTDGNINLRYLRIEPSKYAAFERKMSIVNEKFKNWAQTAKEDNVTNFKKKIPVDFNNEAGYFSMGFSNQYTYTDLFAIFEVDENGKSCLRIDNWEEYDPRNSSYESQMHTPYLYFYSPEDFNKFFEQMKYDNAVKNYKRVKAIVDAAKKAEEDQNARFN